MFFFFTKLSTYSFGSCPMSENVVNTTIESVVKFLAFLIKTANFV